MKRNRVVLLFNTDSGVQEFLYTASSSQYMLAGLSIRIKNILNLYLRLLTISIESLIAFYSEPNVLD